MSYSAVQPQPAAPASAPQPSGPPSVVTAASALLWAMATAGLIYAGVTLAVVPGVVHRFRSGVAGSDDMDNYVSVIWLGAGVALAVAVILFALYAVLGVGLRRGSNGARIATLVISGLGLLGGAAAAITVGLERSGSDPAGSLGERLNGAYPGGWISTNAGLAVAQVVAYAVVLFLVLRAPRAFFGGTPARPAGAPMPPAYGGAYPPGYPAPAQQPYAGMPQPGYPAPGQPGYPAPAPGQAGYSAQPMGQAGYPAQPMGQAGYPAPAPGQPGYPAPAPGQAGYPAQPMDQAGYPAPAPGQPGYPAPGSGQPGYPVGLPGYPTPAPGQPGYAAPTSGQPGNPWAAPGQPGYIAPPPGHPAYADAAAGQPGNPWATPDQVTSGPTGDNTYPGQPGYPAGDSAPPSEYAAPGTFSGVTDQGQSTRTENVNGPAESVIATPEPVSDDAAISPRSGAEAPRASDSEGENKRPATPEMTIGTPPAAPSAPASGSAEASYHGAPPADNGPRAAGDGAPGAVPSEAPPASTKAPASEDEYWKRPSD